MKYSLSNFIAYNYLKNYSFISSAHDSYIVKYLGSSKIFDSVSKDISKGTYSGSTVVLHAIQIAYYMGFSEIYLVGCDTDYSGIHHFDGSTCADIGDPNGANANCNYDETLYSYKLCKYHLEDGKCRIYNSTVGGKLEIFQRKKLEDVVKWKE